ncbi:energy transducer TonB [Hymenobacter jeollabukensis]|uniref:TonB family protein n=1 Tax=Hymenobacter jeollabukensis TaxID=2025313 RepID=A0A5R8WV97_9BACT|nr:energy transducer TonB [Hymenobacter jeollabukensis]TLM95324.1 TonB family protein [Hymenobacter jeollabukensis]
MPPLPPRRNGLSTRQFAWIFGGLLALLTIYQLAQHRPQRFEPPPSGTTAEIGSEAPAQPAPMPNALPEQPAVRDARIYTYVEQMPQPPGGIEGLMQHLRKHIKYPAEARRNQVEGKVFVRFVVQPDGRISDAEVTKGIGAGCDEEALRVISQMPAWTPGKQNGQAVSVYYTVPVTFTIK